MLEAKITNQIDIDRTLAKQLLREALTALEQEHDAHAKILAHQAHRQIIEVTKRKYGGVVK